jgi:hypothetical protein
LQRGSGEAEVEVEIEGRNRGVVHFLVSSSSSFLPSSHSQLKVAVVLPLTDREVCVE